MCPVRWPLVVVMVGIDSMPQEERYMYIYNVEGLMYIYIHAQLCTDVYYMYMCIYYVTVYSKTDHKSGKIIFELAVDRKYIASYTFVAYLKWIACIVGEIWQFL